MLDRLDDEGEIDLLDFFSELTLYTSSACLIGPEFREQLTPAYFPIFYDLEKGTDAIAYVNPYLPLPAFRARDRARARLVELLRGHFERRGEVAPERRELFDILLAARHEDGSPRYSLDQITGMFISMMFAGHHTTSGTAAWTLIELLQNPDYGVRVVAEIDALHAQGADVTHQALREIPVLENGIKEALRLHPPLILLMRKVMFDFHYGGWTVPAGKLVGTSPALSNRSTGRTSPVNASQISGSPSTRNRASSSIDPSSVFWTRYTSTSPMRRWFTKTCPPPGTKSR